MDFNIENTKIFTVIEIFSSLANGECFIDFFPLRRINIERNSVSLLGKKKLFIIISFLKGLHNRKASQTRISCA